MNPWGPQEHLLEAVEKLLQFARPQAALECLNRLVYEKMSFPPELAARALLDSLNVEKSDDNLDQHTALEVIKWLQENPGTDPNVLFQIEWLYLPLLDRENGGVPESLERRMADNPSFFCEVIGIVFRSDKDAHTEKKPRKAESNLAQNAYRLLRGWKTVPGSSTGAFNGHAFESWLIEVKQRTKDSGHFRVATSQIGQVLPYSPSDPDGLWIHRSVAEALNTEDATEMRSGFTRELFNRRGIHVYTAGKEERTIAGGYHEKADALEKLGYHRFATAIRELAKDYERDAERDASQHPFDD